MRHQIMGKAVAGVDVRKYNSGTAGGSIGSAACGRIVAGALLHFAQSCADVCDNFLLPSCHRLDVPPPVAADTVPRGDENTDLLEARPGLAHTWRGAALRTAWQACEALSVGAFLGDTMKRISKNTWKWEASPGSKP